MKEEERGEEKEREKEEEEGKSPLDQFSQTQHVRRSQSHDKASVCIIVRDRDGMGVNIKQTRGNRGWGKKHLPGTNNGDE